jgi:hypothetical protein
MDIVPGAVINYRYRLLEKLGEGGFAVVFKAEDLDLGRLVAIKFLKSSYFNTQEDRERFCREARVLSGLLHRNIITVYAMELFLESIAFIVMEYLEGKSLASLILEKGPLDLNTAGEIFLQVCEALACAHEASVIHRDLSPGNIYLLNEPPAYLVKVIDFGLCRPVSDPGGVRLTRTGVIVGNPAYMSPESARGEPANCCSDIYSLGCVMYETLCGKLPFDAESTVSLLYLQQNSFPSEPQLGGADRQKAENFKKIMLRCLQKDPLLRFNDCRQVSAALKDGMAAIENELPNQGLQQWANSAGTERRRIPAASLVALMIVIILVASLLFQDACFSVCASAFCLQKNNALAGMERSFAELLLRCGRDSLALKLYQDLLKRHLAVGGSPDMFGIGLRCAKMAFAGGLRKQGIDYLNLAMSSAEAGKSEERLTEAILLLNRQPMSVEPTPEELQLREALLEAAVRVPAGNSKLNAGLAENLLDRLAGFAVLNKKPVPERAVEAEIQFLSGRRLELPEQLQEKLLELTQRVSGQLSRKLRQAIVTSAGVSQKNKQSLKIGLIVDEFYANPNAQTGKDCSARLLSLLPEASPTERVVIYARAAVVEGALGRRQQGVSYLEKALQIQAVDDFANLRCALTCLEAAAALQDLQQTKKLGGALAVRLPAIMEDRLYEATTSKGLVKGKQQAVNDAWMRTVPDYARAIDGCLGGGDSESALVLVSDLKRLKTKYGLALTEGLQAVLLKHLKAGTIRNKLLLPEINELLVPVSTGL